MDQNTPQERNELEVADQRAQDDLFQGYLDRMSKLIIDDKLREAEPRSDASVVAQEHTRAVLRRADPKHKGIIVRFLSDSGLIRRRWLQGRGDAAPVLSLRGFDLTNADLSRANLSAAPETNIPTYVVDLQATDLSGADLSNAGLRLIDLRNANLTGVDLSNAMLFQANLSGANLSDAVLMNADLSHAILRGAKVTDEQLAACESLSGATMPDGSKHD